MELFFRLFNPNVPLWLLLVTGTFACLGTVVTLLMSHEGKRNRITVIWLIAYLYIVLYITVMGRTQIQGDHLNLMPFWSIEAIEDGYVETFYEKLYNIIFLFLSV